MCTEHRGARELESEFLVTQLTVNCRSCLRSAICLLLELALPRIDIGGFSRLLPKCLYCS
jgi:hypothetical protein